MKILFCQALKLICARLFGENSIQRFKASELAGNRSMTLTYADNIKNTKGFRKVVNFH